MTSDEKRKRVLKKYDEIIGRNLYSQPLRDYCYHRYDDGNYYSDCSSSICYAYKEVGQSFGITNTAGMYNSSKLTTVELDIIQGIPDMPRLRPGDMLLFAGTDASRPKRIGHVEMYCGNDVICGHGSGRPSYKDAMAYCKNRYNSLAPGGWPKGLVAVKRYIQDDAALPVPVKPKLSGWQQQENGSWSFFLGNSGEPVRNSWYLDEDSRWYWFDGAGTMVSDVWYYYKNQWYYLGSDGAMVTGQQTIDGKWYIMDQNGQMVKEPVTLVPDQDGALQYPGLAE